MTIFFFYPSKILGGAENLFIRLGKYLKGNGHQIFFLDFENGVYSSFFPSETIVICSEKKTVISQGYIIAPAHALYEIPRYLELSEEIKFLFWLIHPFNLIRKLPVNAIHQQYTSLHFNRILNASLYYDYYKNIRSFIKISTRFKGLVSMDFENLRINELLWGIALANVPLLPIPVNHVKVERRVPNLQEGILNISWISRLEDFKVNILTRLIEDLDNLAAFNKIHLHIIGNGTRKQQVVDSIKMCKNLDASFHGNIYGEELKSFMLNNIHLNIGMGTAVLESSILKIPSPARPINPQISFSENRAVRRFQHPGLILYSPTASSALLF